MLFYEMNERESAMMLKTKIPFLTMRVAPSFDVLLSEDPKKTWAQDVENYQKNQEKIDLHSYRGTDCWISHKL
jgi:hypothetical protein